MLAEKIQKVRDLVVLMAFLAAGAGHYELSFLIGFSYLLYFFKLFGICHAGTAEFCYFKHDIMLCTLLHVLFFYDKLVVYALYSYKRMPVCALLQVISMITYTRYLFGATVTTMWPLSVAMLAIILVVGYDLYRQMQIPEAENV